ncbi:DNA methylase [Halorarum salinum]|uniref:DNA methylase n=1 Tax=Halorarum salinum TaxID=2743089 RepID=A0A7D5LA00_9EURY|nr:DNA methylase [Halobaculum salinum]QLG61471.1 DNA methylase [Halobaculum salinum]
MSIDDLESSEPYSEELDIDLRSGDDGELFEWFLASLPFDGRISEGTAKRTYRAFENHDLLTPGAILDAGFDYPVNPMMREGGYVRHDNRRSEQVLRDCETLIEEYDGSLNALHEAAADAEALEERIDAFHGVGPVTTNIFLRELRPIRAKTDPEPLDVVREAAARANVDPDRYDRKSEAFVRVEAGLIRRRHEH